MAIKSTNDSDIARDPPSYAAVSSAHPVASPDLRGPEVLATSVQPRNTLLTFSLTSGEAGPCVAHLSFFASIAGSTAEPRSTAGNLRSSIAPALPVTANQTIVPTRQESTPTLPAKTPMGKQDPSALTSAAFSVHVSVTTTEASAEISKTAMDPELKGKGKGNEDTNRHNAASSPYPPPADPTSVCRDPRPSCTPPESSNAIAGPSRGPLQRTGSARSSGSSVYGSWTLNPFETPLESTWLKVEKLEAEKAAKAQAMKLIDDLADELTDKMDIVTYDDE
ncbi:hypothetical protein M407DRAFT_26157 [Tulasnella calospora MUT 4182]|uniref:Uncharacterized protein n=1 Tax=Tulasnella calospora MUT 4182 TaxID=1051891 RepID=A0A0C3KSL5_9AGAM|nr:hypothetical protein M407DRAFT_26157 [Tulasnella calospora MUT 4182]